MGTAKQWEVLANEAIEDAGYWKREARKTQETSRDLLAALQNLVNDLAGEGSQEWVDGITQEARAAIAKATGEE